MALYSRPWQKTFPASRSSRYVTEAFRCRLPYTRTERWRRPGRSDPLATFDIMSPRPYHRVWPSVNR